MIPLTGKVLQMLLVAMRLLPKLKRRQPLVLQGGGEAEIINNRQLGYDKHRNSPSCLLLPVVVETRRYSPVYLG